MSEPNGNSPEFVPSWMAEFGVKKREEWMDLSKAQLRVLQRPDKPLKVQIWATGILHAAGYKGQVAYTMRNGKKVLLTSGDISTELHRVAIKYYTDAGIKATDRELAGLKEEKEEIRRAMVDLEEDGVSERQDSNGTPLRDLPAEKLKRLPSGKTRLLFWLIPRSPNRDKVAQQWRQRQEVGPPPAPPEVGIQCLPLPPIWKILNVFQIDKPEKAVLSNPDYQKRVERAYQAAKEKFIEVVNECLPQGVPESPPEVGVTGGAFEVVREEVREEAPRAGGSSKDGSARPPAQKPPREGGEEQSVNQQYAPPRVANQNTAAFSQQVEARRPAEVLYEAIPRWQDDHKGTKFARQKFDALGKADKQLTQHILDALQLDAISTPAEETALFVEFVEQRFADGRAPGQPGGPEKLGLLIEWAGDFTRERPERLREQEQATAAEAKQRERAAEQRRADDAERLLDHRTEQYWETLPAGDKGRRMKTARDRLKAEARWERMSEEMRQSEITRYAVAALKEELRGAGGKGASGDD